MERRDFLKLFGLGIVAAGAAAAAMTPAEAGEAAMEGPASVDDFIKDLAEANEGKGEFAQYWRRRRWRRWRRRRWRRRHCRTIRTRWGWRRICRW